jgi:hypothetical protein
MFTQAWKKYLPVIYILLKRSVSDEQTLHMNRSDFERAAGGRKIKFNFSVTLNKGKLEINSSAPPLVKDLVTLLSEDLTTRPLVRKQNFEFVMSSNFQLLIRGIDPPADETASHTDQDTEHRGVVAGDSSASV